MAFFLYNTDIYSDHEKKTELGNKVIAGKNN